MDNDELRKRIREWLVKECLGGTGQSEEDMIEIAADDILKILADIPANGKIDPQNFLWLTDNLDESIEVACAKELSVPLTDEFLLAFKDISEEMVEPVLKVLYEKATLAAAERDPDTPLN